MKIKELLDNSWDIGLASGVLQGIELTPTLLPNQKESIADARKALDRVAKRNQAALEGHAAQLSEAPNEKAEPPPTHDVNRDSGTDSANGGWLRRLVRRRHIQTYLWDF